MTEAISDLWHRAKTGDPQAQLELAQALRDAEEGANPTKAMLWCRRAAKQGLPAAQRLLGELYLEGEGVMQDDAMGVEWIARAARSGDRQAIDQLEQLAADGQEEARSALSQLG